MQLGPRVIKTGLSITLALYLCDLFDLEPSILAAVAAITSIQPSIYLTWRQSWDQFRTNSLGAAAALLAIHLIGNSPIVIGVVAILVILISLKLKMENTIVLSLVTVIALMESPRQDWIFALERFSIILIGAASAFVVNIAVWRPNQVKRFDEKLHVVLGHLSLLLSTAISNELTGSASRERREQFRSELSKLEELYRLLEDERQKMARIKQADARRMVVYKQMLQTFHKGEEVLEHIESHFFQNTDDKQVEAIFDAHLEGLIKYHELILLKFDGKARRVDDDSSRMLQNNGAFMNKVMQLHNGDAGHLRLILVGSSVFDYGFELNRLDRVVEQLLGVAADEKISGQLGI